MSRLDTLERIHTKIRSSPENITKELRREFWRLVREIKREPHPDSNEVELAATIREILFEDRRGKTYPLCKSLAIQFSISLLVSTIPYLYLLTFPLDWFSISTWTISNWFLFFLRFITVFLGIALFYPLGRLIGAKLIGIRILGVCWDDFHEPTLKIDYVSFLQTSPPKRKWFFFIGGIWTVITSLLYWIVGMVLSFDYTGFIPMTLILIFEIYVIVSRKATYRLGEMGLFNRERKIEEAWRKKLEL